MPLIKIIDSWNNTQEVLLSAPDETGEYDSKLGKIGLDLTGIDPRTVNQSIAIKGLGSTCYGGSIRRICLSSEGIGGQSLNEYSHLEVRLFEQIRRVGEWERVRDGKKVIGWRERAR